MTSTRDKYTSGEFMRITESMCGEDSHNSWHGYHTDSRFSAIVKEITMNTETMNKMIADVPADATPSRIVVYYDIEYQRANGDKVVRHHHTDIIELPLPPSTTESEDKTAEFATIIADLLEWAAQQGGYEAPCWQRAQKIRNAGLLDNT